MQGQIQFDNNYTLDASGAIVFETIDSILDSWKQITSLIIDLPKVNISCSNLEIIDSSFMAFLIEVKRFCNQHGVRFSITGLDDEKQDFLSAYGVLDVLS